MRHPHMQIGEVAEQSGLSLRTIRYYEEVGLAVPSARSAGGFRLYTEADLARLRLIKRMKPSGFSLEEMRDALDTLDALHAAGDSAGIAPLLERLEALHLLAEERAAKVREKLRTAEEFAADIKDEIARAQRRS